MIVTSDSIPFGSLPVFYTGENEQYYTVTNIDDNGELTQLKGRNRICVPLFEQVLTKEYTTKRTFIERIFDFVDNRSLENHLEKYSRYWNKEVKNKKIVPNHIIKLFENIGCAELCYFIWRIDDGN